MDVQAPRKAGGEVPRSAGGDEDLGFAILNNVGDFLLLKPIADGRVVKPSPLRGPAQGEESRVVLHHDGDVVPHREPKASNS